jgi:hypothetical protein
MINIQRTTVIPTSLQNPDIQAYIDAVSSWNENPIGTKPEPTVSYRSSDVLQAFNDCFFSKCYLTEQRFETSYMMDIEHFYSKSEFPEKRYEWSNLYPADHNANMAKPRKMPEGGYLDPCNPNDDVETAIFYYLGFGGGDDIGFEAVDKNNPKAVNTVLLLDRIHNGHDYISREKVRQLKQLIYKKQTKIINEVCHWLAAQKNNDPYAENGHRLNLKRLLSRKSSFTMLMRSIDVVQKHLPKADFFD